MCEGLIFGNIANFEIQILKEDIDLFKGVLNDKKIPDEFIMQTNEGVFIVNKRKKTLRIFERKYKNNKLKKDEIDSSTYVVSKIASKCGFTIFLDTQYSN
jgi:hypothetical protein